jgi:hypothetical protein
VGGLETPSAKEIPEFRFVPNAPSAPPTAAPMANGGGLPPQLAQAAVSDNYAADILRSAFASKTISPSDAAKVRAALPPEADAAFFGWLQANNISLPSKRGDGMPLQRTTAPQSGYESKLMDDGMGGYEPTGRVARGKSPMQSPMPGSAIVPLPRVKKQSAAEESGKQDVRVATEPQIVAGQERVKRLEKLRGDLPQARSEAQAVVDNLASRINAIDEFLSSKDRWSVIGPIEGNLPRILQFGPRADMQRLWDTITNNDVLQTVLTARAQTSTGGSPLGNLSNSDLKFIVGASTPLTQTGVPEVQDQRMFKLRRALVEKLNTQKQTFDDTFREVSAETPNIRLKIPNISPTFRPKTAASGGGLRTGDPEMDAIMRKHGGK